MKKIFILKVLLLVTFSTVAQKEVLLKSLKNIQEEFEEVSKIVESTCDSIFTIRGPINGKSSNEGLLFEISGKNKINIGMLDDSIFSPVITEVYKYPEDSLVISKILKPSSKYKGIISTEFNVNQSGQYKIKFKLKKRIKNNNGSVTWYICYK